MAVFGYARVSTDGQTLAAQDAALRAARCAKVYAEKAKQTGPSCAKSSLDSARATYWW
jgi:DNA invertase Pin-like site-specific DNA recombinase